MRTMCASTGQETANLCVAVPVIIGPHNSRTEPIGLSHHGRVRHHNPFSLNSHAIVPILRVPIDILQAKAQHNPFLLASRSNHSSSGELAKRPSSRACE